MLPPCLAPQIIASKFDDQDIEEAIMEQISDIDDDSNDDHGELKVGDSYGNRASQTAPSTPRWTSCGVRLLSTAGFVAPQPDAEAPDLVYKDKRDMENKVNMFITLLLPIPNHFLVADPEHDWCCWQSLV
jgi:hypothetical protein